MSKEEARGIHERRDEANYLLRRTTDEKIVAMRSDLVLQVSRKVYEHDRESGHLRLSDDLVVYGAVYVNYLRR